jgi:hypothetical protein
MITFYTFYPEVSSATAWLLVPQQRKKFEERELELVRFS